MPDAAHRPDWQIRAFERPITVLGPADVPSGCKCTWAPQFTLLEQTATAPDGRRYPVSRYQVTAYVLKQPSGCCPIKSHLR